MIVILEGCDCTGKSTFAELLSEKTGYEVVKGSSFEISELGADGMFEYMMNLLDKDDIIIDRFFHSNLVYGKLFNYPMMSLEQYDLLVEKLDKRALTVYLYAPLGTIANRMSKRGDDMIKIENVQDILDEYMNVMYGDFRPKSKFVIDTSSSNINFATAMVKEMIDQDMVKTYIRN